MKPLTTDELKALKDGDWVWVDMKCGIRTYGQIIHTEMLEHTGNYDFVSLTDRYLPINADYGTKWIAYKNKEQAEIKTTNGSVLRMLSNKELAEFLCSDGLQRLKMSYTSSVIGLNDWLEIELNETEAEKRLAELKGVPQ